MTGYSYVYTEGWMKQSERDIHNVCNLSSKELYERKWNMHREINSWRDDLVRQIDDHVRHQIELLEKEYQKQKDGVEDTRQQFLNATRPLEFYPRNNEQINQLLEQCKALKFELTALEFPERSIPFIQFMTEEQLKQRKRDEKKTEKPDDHRSRGKSGEDFGNFGTENSGKYRNQTPAASNQDNRSAPGTAYRLDSSATSNNSSKSNGDMIPKCPTCCMIFPNHMSGPERDRHALEHKGHS